MKIKGIIWLQEVVEKVSRKHHVLPSEVREVLVNQPHFRLVEKGYRQGENVYAGLGKTEAGRYLVVFFIHKTDGRALILTARDMTRAERRLYEKN